MLPCIKIGSGKNLDLEAIGHEYVSCPLLLIELLSRLAKPEPQFFTKDLKSFLFLSNDGTSSFLDFPGAFVLKEILGTSSPVARFNKADFRDWCRCVLLADSRDALSNADVVMGSYDPFSYGLDFLKIIEQQEKGRIEWNRLMSAKRKAKYFATAPEYAVRFLANQGILPKPGDVEAVSEALDAALAYQRYLINTEESYDFGAEKHRGDWVDFQLLYYLADPNMHIVTNDTKVKSRCGSSKQSGRIIVI